MSEPWPICASSGFGPSSSGSRPEAHDIVVTGIWEAAHCVGCWPNFRRVRNHGRHQVGRTRFARRVPAPSELAADTGWRVHSGTGKRQFQSYTEQSATGRVRHNR
jgi:hypothetical protein